MLNLFGFRATQPTNMIASYDPVGPGNDEALRRYGTRAGLVVAAWGSIRPRYKLRLQWETRIQRVLSCIAKPIYCLGTTKDGSLRHPSRLGYNTERMLFWSPDGR